MQTKRSTGTIFVIAAAVVALAGGFLVARPAPAQPSDLEHVGSISVTGSSAIRVQPDRVVVAFGVETFGDTPSAARDVNAGRAKLVMASLRGLGIADKDIATASFTLQPEYDDWSNHRTIVGYWARNTIVVTLRDVAQLETVLVAGLEAGANAVDGIEFSVTNLRELRDQARAQAVQAAMEKAAAMAGVANLALGDVTNINENSWYSGYYGPSGRQWTNMQNVVQDLSDAGALTIEDGSIALGQIVVRAEVSLSAQMVRGE
jgi:uncharacterized protein YggE